jgi:hypothetical protein
MPTEEEAEAQTKAVIDALERAAGPPRKRRQFEPKANGKTANTGGLVALPYSWPDPATIPPRQFLYDRHYVRKAIGATIGGGGRAKTTLGITDFIGMAIGRNLFTGEAIAPLRPWLLNGEEDQDELNRRVAAACQHHGITEADCGGRLFVQSVRDHPLRLAVLSRNAAMLNRTALDALETQIREKQIDVFGLDPWVSFHSVNENANEHMDLLIKEGLGGIVSRTNTACELFHHPGKPKPGQAETVVEDARGASAIIWAVRSARVLNFMTPQEAERLGIAEDDRRLHIRILNGKANMGPLGKAIWIALTVKNLSNGDQVVAASSWKPKNPFDGVSATDMYNCRRLAQTGAYRMDSRSPDWIGYMIAEQLHMNVRHGAENNPADIARIKEILRAWIKKGVLATEDRKDKDHKDRQFVVPGNWNDDVSTNQMSDDDILQ